MIEKFRKPRLYASVNSSMPPEYYDYDRYEVEFGEADGYQIMDKLGRGKYSEVYSGIHAVKASRVVIKVLKPVKKKKIKR